MKPRKCTKCRGTDLFFLEHYDYYAYHRQVVVDGKVYLEDEGNSMEGEAPSPIPVKYECKSCGYWGFVRYDTFARLHREAGRIDQRGKIVMEPSES